MISIEYVWTDDGLRLQGIHYLSKEVTTTCVLMVHGMGGNFQENYFGHVLGEQLSYAGYGYMYAHNRGYNHINDIPTKQRNKENGNVSKRHGASYERFEDSVFDIEAWVNHIKKLRYKRIIIIGHSLGANKVIHYIHKKKPSTIVGVVLMSPPDMVGNGKEAGSSTKYDSLVKEANELISQEKPRELLSELLWEWSLISAQTFLDLFIDGCPADNLPIMRSPKSFPELASVTQPILAIMGEFDDIVIRTLQDDMDVIADKAINAQSFTQEFIRGANHSYENKEEELTRVVINWMKNRVQV